MKKIILLAAVLCAGTLAAKEVWVYENNGAIRTVPLSAVDSIGFNTYNDLLLYYKGSNYSYYTNRVNSIIDSVVFKEAEEVPPRVDMFYCEFVPAGEELRVRGRNLFSPKVYFYDANDNLLQSPKVRTGENGMMMYVTVPEGATHSRPIVVETAGGTTASKILFRDRRNMIVDFDEYRGFGGWLRDWEEEGFPFPTFRNDDYLSGIHGYLPSVYCPNEYLWSEQLTNPTAFPKGCDGRYNLINDWNDGNWHKPNRIQFHIKDDPDEPTPNPRRDDQVQSMSLMGPFNEYDPRKMVLKFEVYVPKQYPINGAWLYIYFPPAGGDPWDSNLGWGLLNPTLEPVEKQVPLGFWCPFEADIDKTDEPWKWRYGVDCKEPFHTNDTWMTVSVPLSKVIYHGWNQNPGSHLHKGDTGIPFDYGDDGNPALSPNTVLSKDPTKALGDMIVQFPVWSGKGNQSGKFMLFVDNFRLVPEDGNGAVHGRGTGVIRDINTGAGSYALETLSAVSVSGIDNDGSVTPLVPNTTVTIYGNRLDLVEKIIFTTGAETVPDQQSASQLSFVLPLNAASGIFKLEAVVGAEKNEIVYVEGRNIRVQPPVITQVKCATQASLENLPPCGTTMLIISGTHFDRILAEYPDGIVPVLLSSRTIVYGTLNGNEISVVLPSSLSFYESYSIVGFYSFGELVASNATFSIAKPVFNYELVHVAGNNYYIYITGDNLCSLKSLRFTRTNGNEANGAQTAIENGWRFALANLDISKTKMKLVFESGDEVEFDVVF